MANQNPNKFSYSGVLLQVKGTDSYWFEVRGEDEDNAGALGFIGGGGEEGETPLDTMHREIAQETRRDPDSLQLKLVGVFPVKGERGDTLKFSLFHGVIAADVELELNEAGKPVKSVKRTHSEVLGKMGLSKVAAQVVDRHFLR